MYLGRIWAMPLIRLAAVFRTVMHYLEHERLPEWSIGPYEFAPLESRYCACTSMCSQHASNVDDLQHPHSAEDERPGVTMCDALVMRGSLVIKAMRGGFKTVNKHGFPTQSSAGTSSIYWHFWRQPTSCSLTI